MTGISEKLFLQQPRETERDGLVAREQFNQIPPRVEYSLTLLGRSAMDALMPLCAWGERHLADAIPERGEDEECCGADPEVPAATTV